jgi:hypothetical protein
VHEAAALKAVVHVKVALEAAVAAAARARGGGARGGGARGGGARGSDIHSFVRFCWLQCAMVKSPDAFEFETDF